LQAVILSLISIVIACLCEEWMSMPGKKTPENAAKLLRSMENIADMDISVIDFASENEDEDEKVTPRNNAAEFDQLKEVLSCGCGEGALARKTPCRKKTPGNAAKVRDLLICSYAWKSRSKEKARQELEDKKTVM
jgi:hypothetical protein